MKNGDKSAFAVEGIYDSGAIGRGSATGFVINPQMGLTKREYFAAMAMQGIMGNSQILPNKSGYEYCAQVAINSADALLTELDKPTP